ncbi:hypothetical protein [Bacillus massilinigeriensis]|uniref:hypothetical protein n=1 Tax=Bacillus mediterraneensis TaxID=1805474 RepID=UPI0009F17A12|nr:hypothetical protein [Bacillus mediterraneensis]
MTDKTRYRNPGAGAVEFAAEFLAGFKREEAAVLAPALLRGELHDPSDKRVKRCGHCGYYWRDNSLRNTKRTCSDECKTGIKSLQKRQQRADAALLDTKPKKHKLMDDYIWWLEYPFWIHEYSMIKIGWKFERPSGIALMDYVETSRNQMGDGNRKKSNKHVDYHGDDRDLF